MQVLVLLFKSAFFNGLKVQMQFFRSSEAKKLFRHSGGTLAATLAVQASNFFLLAVAAQLLTTEEFARLSSIVAVVMMSSALFEFGLNVTATKIFGESRDKGVFSVAAKIRVWTLLIVMVVSSLLWVVSPADVLLAITLGAFTNVWNGMRATDQAMQQFRAFAKSSLLFALFRMLITLPLLFFVGDAVSTAIGLYFAPLAALMLVAGGWRDVRSGGGGQIKVAEIFSYAKFVYPNSIIFIALPYLPQLYIGDKLSFEAAASYGLIVAFSGPVGLLIYSLRATLLPKLFGQGALERRLWSTKGGLLLSIAWVFLLVTGGVFAEILEFFYGERFDGIRSAFLVYFAGISLTGILGIYGLSVHTLGVPQVSLYVNGLRAVALVCGLIQFGFSLMSVVLVLSTIMAVGEIVLLIVVYRCRRRCGL